MKRQVFCWPQTLVVLLGIFLSVRQAPAKSAPLPTAAPVLLGDQTILTIRTGIQSFTPADRAETIGRRLVRIAVDPLFSPSSISLDAGDSSTEILAGESVIMSVTDTDAKAEGMGRAELAQKDAGILGRALQNYRDKFGWKALVRECGLAFLATLALLLILKGLGWGARKGEAFIHDSKGKFIPRLGIRKVKLLSTEQMAGLLIRLLRLARIAVVLILLYIFFPLVLGFFPWTEALSGKIWGYVLDPIASLGAAIKSYIPNLLFIIVILVAVKYLLKVVHLFFRGIKRGGIVLSGFHRDWADPTYMIARFIILAFTLVAIFPYLPGSSAPAFKGVSVFLGLLLSLGSGSAVANVVAGVILTYMRPFQIGDRVKISDTVGDVLEKSMLVTRVQTLKNEIVTIPNAMVLGSHLINYSSSARDKGLVLHTSVTLGYDLPWRKAHSLLIAAAQETDNILAQPAPFVLQTALGDFSVAYELNAYTDRPDLMAPLYSTLHQNIQDQFNRAGVEILSPHYAALRDGNRATLPEEHLPKGYQAPGFKVGTQVEKPVEGKPED